MNRRLTTILACALAAALGIPAVADAARPAKRTTKKAIWGPEQINGVSQFPIYRDLGVGIYQTGLNWATIARTRPANATDPNDPAYRWPAYLDYTVAEASRYRIKVAVNLTRAPEWANGGQAPEAAPLDEKDFADFATAASKRYPTVKYWIVWGEPSRSANFQPMPANSPTGPRRYARILDAAYVALKQVSRSDFVVGGNTFTAGDVTPFNFLRWMRVRKRGRWVPPRLDLYGHNPFGPRRPFLGDRALGGGLADFGTLDTFAKSLDRTFKRPKRKRVQLYLAEYTMPSGGRNITFGDLYTSEKNAAKYLSSALKITRQWSRVHTFGWFKLYDENPRDDGLETRWGLLTHDGRPKRTYQAYKRG